uniref:Uncharacterized protein n=1 Tax=Panagrolaimus davidi TaxID=227884 RepID=A0A914PPZ9_9BILA
MLLKDLNTPYTPEAPCKQVNPPFYGSGLSKSNFCCKKFRAFDNAQSCAEYRSFTKVYYAAYKGIYFDVRYKFNGTAMIVSILSYGNPVVSTMQIESYSTDTFSQTCQVSTTSPQNTCIFKLSATNQYQLLFRTSENRDGINMTSLYASGTQIFDPYLSPSKPCKAWYQFSNSNSNYGDRAVTEFCCISQPGGEWPGALNSFGYPNPFGDNHFPLQKQERQIVDKTYITTKSKHM